MKSIAYAIQKKKKTKKLIITVEKKSIMLVGCNIMFNKLF